MKVLNNQIFGFGANGDLFLMNDDLTWDSLKSGWGKEYSAFQEGMAFGNGKYVIVGWEWKEDHDSFRISEDGKDWDYYNYGRLLRGSIWDITYGMGIFVLVGSRGHIFVSEDALNWNSANFIDEITLLDVIFVNNKFIAVSEDKTIISEDGVNWDYVGCNCGGRSIIFRAR